MTEGPRKSKFSDSLSSAMLSAKPSLKKLIPLRFFRVYGKVLVFAFIVFSIPLKPVSGSSSKSNTPLHHFDLSCSSCHQGGTGAGELTGSINTLCRQAGCHIGEESLNHPVGVNVPLDLPESMPLESGDLTCLTCHSGSAGKKNKNTFTERYVTVPNGIQFCGSCHEQLPGFGTGSYHWQSMPYAHLDWRAQSGAGSKITGGLDEETWGCISCHDDVTVTTPNMYENHKNRRDRWRNMPDHPIGMDLQRVMARNPGDYRMSVLNHNKIRLFDGAMGCGSCHSIYSQEPNIFVMDNYKSRICQECHNR